MDGRIGQWIYRMVAGMFCVLMAGIFWATLVIDKNFPNLFPNTVRHKNMFYYMAAACLGIGLWFLYKKIKISSRLFYIAMVFIFLAAALVQWKVSTWMLVPNSGGGILEMSWEQQYRLRMEETFRSLNILRGLPIMQTLLFFYHFYTVYFQIGKRSYFVGHCLPICLLSLPALPFAI